MCPGRKSSCARSQAYTTVELNSSIFWVISNHLIPHLNPEDGKIKKSNSLLNKQESSTRNGNNFI
jgi:hypothetical protein